MNGYIYFLTNKSMPDLVKIGYTTGTVESRLSQLNCTSVPISFNVIAQFYVCEPKIVEKSIHTALDDLRLNDKREFFSGSIKIMLKRCYPVLMGALAEPDESESKYNKTSNNMLTDIAQLLLLELVDNRNTGRNIFNFEDNEQLNYNSLVLERELEYLKNDRFVEFSRSTMKWYITGKGIAMMFEVGLLLENELSKPGDLWV